MSLHVGAHDVTAMEQGMLEALLAIEPWCDHLARGLGYVHGCSHCEINMALDGIANDQARQAGEQPPCHHRRAS